VLMIADLEEQLVNVSERISKEDSQLTYWKEFRDLGQHDNDKTIHLLEQELVDMEASFTEISGMTFLFTGILTSLDKLIYVCSIILGSFC